MCGIAGILTTDREADHAGSLMRMNQALRHRGPDDHGTWHQRDGIAHFTNTRLSILDLSAAGHQPMSTPDGAYTITFNGEIYNFAELRAGLEREGVAFQTHSDTEVILRLYEKHGANGVELLRGMFAFALWDEHQRTCLLARDRFGIKPLYVAQEGTRVVFASELRTILASGLMQPKTNGQALTRYLQTGSVPEPWTIASGVRMLEAGSTLQWQDGKSQSRRWSSIAFPSVQLSMTPVEASAQTRAALLDSVEHHFVSDVPVGIFLSAGLDSTALLALAHSTGRRNIRTFSIGVDDPARDECALARRTAQHFGTQHSELRLTAEKARELFAKFLEVMDQPTIDGFNTYCVAGLAREHGTKVVLSGLGGDELFGGYPSFMKLPLLRKISRTLGPLRGAAGALLQKIKRRPPLVRLGSALQDGASLEQLYDAFRGIFSSNQAHKLAEWMMREPIENEEQEQDHEQERGHEQDMISALELRRYMRNQLLRDSDVMSMAHGLELRVPLVDGPLFDAVSRIPAPLRLRPGKQLLMDAVPEIPEWVRQRRKTGFIFPYDQWLATPEWQAMFADALRNLPVPVTSWYQRWAVFVFRHWQKTSATPA